jgi:hypothetical protein
MEDVPFSLRVYEQEGKIVVMLEQEEGLLYLTFPNEQKYSEFLGQIAPNTTR